MCGPGQFRMQHFHRNRSVVPEVLGEVHSRHATAAELTLECVAIRKRGAETVQNVSQCGIQRGWKMEVYTILPIAGKGCQLEIGRAYGDRT